MLGEGAELARGVGAEALLGAEAREELAVDGEGEVGAVGDRGVFARCALARFAKRRRAQERVARDAARASNNL